MHDVRPLIALSLIASLAASVPAQAQTKAQTAAQARAAAQVRARAAAAASSVGGVTVKPQTPPQGRVVSSTNATSITSPNYSAEDAKPPPRAISLGGNSAAGVQAADSAPIAGLPASQAGGARHSDLGVTTVF